MNDMPMGELAMLRLKAKEEAERITYEKIICSKERISELRNELYSLKKENKDLRKKNEELTELIKRREIMAKEAQQPVKYSYPV